MTTPRYRFAAFNIICWILTITLGIPASAATPTGTIEGRVSSARSGEYLEKAKVAIAGTSAETFTGPGGYFRLPAVPVGNAQVTFTYTGFEPTVASVIVIAGENTQYDIALGGGGTQNGGGLVKLSKFVVADSRAMDGAAIAINEQRYAANITRVVSSGEFGIIADGSVGEFLKYIPGVTINYAGGTANQLSLDGAPANNVPFTVGGFSLASSVASSTSRATELLQMSIQHLSRIEVVTSPTPESPGEALSGSINLVPRSAFELVRPVFTGSIYLLSRDVEIDFDKTPGPLPGTKTRKVTSGFDFSYIAPVNKRFGYSVSGSFNRQYLPQDTVANTWRGVGAPTTGLTAATAVNQYPDTTPDAPYLSAFSLTNQKKFNDRSSLGLTADYKPFEKHTLSFSYQYGTFGSELNNLGLSFTIDRIDPGEFGTTYAHGASGKGRLALSSTGRYRFGTTHMPTLTWRYRGDVWQAESGIGYSRSTNFHRDITKGYFGSTVAQRTGVTVSFDDIYYLRPGTITVTDPASGARVNPYILSNYSLSSVASQQPRNTYDVKRSAYANLRREANVRGIPVSVKIGLDMRQSTRDLRGTTDTWNYVGADGLASTTPIGSDDGAALVVDEVLSPISQPFGFPQIEWINGRKAADLYRTQPAQFVTNLNTSYRNEVGFSKYVNEVISSAYLRTDAAFFNRRLKLIGGIRAEQANVSAEGPLSDPTLNFQRDAQGNVLREANGSPIFIIPTADALGVSRLTFQDRGMHASKEYLRLFPSLNASLALKENLVVRAAVSTSVGRPDFNQYAGGITLPNLDVPPSSGNMITVNNVGIKTWSATSYKARIEYYFAGVGQISIGGFRREIENFFANSIAQATPAFLALYSLGPDLYEIYSVTTQRNLDSAVVVSGFDIDYKQALTFLPPWARGVQVFANAATLRTTGVAVAAANLAGYVPRTYNWGVSLTRKSYNLRANWNYRGRQRQTQVAAGRGIDPATFNWGSKKLILDVQGEYKIAPHLSVFSNLRNATDATDDFEVSNPRTPSHAQFLRREDYAASWTFGLKGTF